MDGRSCSDSDHTYASYTEEILSEQLPEVLDSNLAESADVFCNPLVHHRTTRMFASIREGGWTAMHVDEFTDGEEANLLQNYKSEQQIMLTIRLQIRGKR